MKSNVIPIKERAVMAKGIRKLPVTLDCFANDRLVCLLVGIGLLTGACSCQRSTPTAATLWNGSTNPASRESAPQVVDEGTVATAVNCDLLRPTVHGIIDVDRAQLDEVTGRLQPAYDASLSTLLHGLHLWGPNLCVTSTGGSGALALDLLLDCERGKVQFGGAVPLASTRYGARVPLYVSGLLGTEQPSAQAHPGQLLSVLAQLGIPLSHPIRLVERNATVQDILNDTLANLQLSERELAWYAVAIAIYIPAETWTDKWGKSYRLDDMAMELVGRSPEDSSCGGSHELIALTVILRVDDVRQVLVRAVRDQVTTRLRNAVSSLERTQRADASWGMDWDVASEDGMRTATSDLDSHDALLVTGHHLEWLTMLPERLSPEPSVMGAAGLWLSRALPIQTVDPELVVERYCPLIHAARSVRLLAAEGS